MVDDKYNIAISGSCVGFNIFTKFLLRFPSGLWPEKFRLFDTLATGPIMVSHQGENPFVYRSLLDPYRKNHFHLCKSASFQGYLSSLVNLIFQD
jgi:hypothetical protein